MLDKHSVMWYTNNMNEANYRLEAVTDKYVLIRDIGPWGRKGFKTITNAAEEVIYALYCRGVLVPNKTLYYYDSNGQIAKLVHSNGQFIRFDNYLCKNYV